MPPSADRPRRGRAARPPRLPLGEAGGGDARGGDRGDLLRSRAQLLAENAFLRQQLLVLRRSVTRPAVTPADRALLVLLAGRVRAWRQALLLVQPETLLRWHRAGFRALWRRKSRPGPGRPPLAGGDRRPDPADGGREPALGRRADPRRAGQAGHPRGQAHHPDLPARHRARPRPRGQTWATFLRNHAARDLGLRLPAGDRPPLPAAVRLLRRRAGHAAGGPCRRDAPPDRRLGRPAAARGHPVRPAPALPHPRQRRQVRGDLRPRRRGQRHHDPAHALSARRGRTPSASASWAACGASAWTTCSSSASATSPACCASTWPTSTGRGRTRASARRSPSHRRERRGGEGPVRAVPVLGGRTTPTSAPRKADGCISARTPRCSWTSSAPGCARAAPVLWLWLALDPADEDRAGGPPGAAHPGVGPRPRSTPCTPARPGLRARSSRATGCGSTTTRSPPTSAGGWRRAGAASGGSPRPWSTARSRRSTGGGASCGCSRASPWGRRNGCARRCARWA